MMMMVNDDNDHDNDHEISVRGNVKGILGIRNSLSCYEKKANEKR